MSSLRRMADCGQRFFDRRHRSTHEDQESTRLHGSRAESLDRSALDHGVGHFRADGNAIEFDQ